MCIYTFKCLSFFILSLQKETTRQQFSHQPEEEFNLRWLFQRDLMFQACRRSQFRADFFCWFRCSHLTFLPENPASSATSAVPGKGSWRVANTLLFCATKTWDGLVCSRFSFPPIHRKCSLVTSNHHLIASLDVMVAPSPWIPFSYT